MRLVRLKVPGSLENLQLLEEDRPEPGPGELLVRIRACSLNFRDDWWCGGKPRAPMVAFRYPMALEK